MLRVLIPAYKEAANLPRLFADLQRALQGEPYTIAVVLDASDAETAAVVRAHAGTHPVTIVEHPPRAGVAAAFREGFRAVVREAGDTDCIVLMEGDGTSTPALVPEILARLRSGADVVIASRYLPGGGYAHFPLKRLLLSKGANLVFRLLVPIAGVRDYSIFFRGYRVSPLQQALAAHGEAFITSETFFANIEVLLKLQPYLHRVDEVPLWYDYSKKQGKSRMSVGKNLRSYIVFLARHVFRRS